MPVEYRLSLPYPNPSLGQIMTTRPQSQNPRDGGAVNDPAKEISNEANGPVSGARRVVLMLSLLAGLLISTLDTSIVSTSLVTISKDLDDFVNASWIVLAYLLTYMGFAVCIAKLSDIYGRKSMIVLSWFIFISFSMGCGSSKSMTALIICRAFQGVGASGLYSLTQIGLVEVGPGNNPSLIGAMIGMTLAVSFVSGPLIGGLISHYSDWRWIFNINIPFGLVAILGIINFWPEERVAHMFSWEAFITIDFIGSATLLCSSGLVVFALQQAGSQTFAWGSPEIVSALVISGLCFAAFIWWEVTLGSKRHRHIEPVFPIRLVLGRVYSSGLVVTLLTGFPYIALTIIIPERFQVVNGENVLMAGVHILPLLGACAVGSFLGGAISRQRNNTSYTMVGASSLQLIGVGLMTTVAQVDESGNKGTQYAYQAIFGLGVGLSFSAATIMTNIFASDPSDRASAQGAVAQARVLGGSIGLAICTVIFNAHVNKYLEDHLDRGKLEALHRSPLAGLQLPVNQRELVKSVYAGAFAEQIKVMAGICAVMVAVSLFSLERHPAPLQQATTTKEEDRASDSGVELNDRASIRQGAV